MNQHGPDFSAPHAWARRRFFGRLIGVWLCGACALGSAGSLSLAEESETAKGGASTNLMGMSLDQLLDIRVDKVYGASRYEQKIWQAPSSVTIVSRDEIQKQGYRTLAEVLRSVRGLYLTYDRAYSYLGIRGFGRPSDYNSRVLVLVDGHRLNDNIYDGALLGTEALLDVDLIERMEVIRGPSSSIYGDNAFFGVINIFTRPGAGYGGLEASVEGGSFETFRGRLSYGKHFTNGLELVLSGTWQDSAGEQRLFYKEFDQPANNNGVAENSDDDQSGRFFGKLAYGDFTLSGAWSKRTKNIPTASFGTIFNDGGELAIDEYAYADFKYEHTFSGDVTVLGKAYYDSYRTEGHFPFNVAPPGNPIVRVLNKDVAYGQWAGVDGQFIAPFGERLKVTAGADYRLDLRKNQLNYDVSPPAVYVNADTGGTWNAGVYGQGEFTILTNLLLSAGARYDYYDTFGGTVNPRASLVYSPWIETAFKLIYGQAYRAPNTYELFYGGLKPETIRTYEAVYEQDLPAKLRFSAAGYHYEINDLISENGGVFNNLGRVKANGLEFELEGKYARGLIARTSYALQRTEDDTNGSELSNSPRHLFKGSVIVPLYAEKIYAGLELQYTSEVITQSRQTADGYLLANFTLFSRELVPGLELSASVYNLFDAHYSHPASTAHVQDTIEQPGRSFRVKLTYRF